MCPTHLQALRACTPANVQCAAANARTWPSSSSCLSTALPSRRTTPSRTSKRAERFTTLHASKLECDLKQVSKLGTVPTRSIPHWPPFAVLHYIGNIYSMLCSTALKAQCSTPESLKQSCCSFSFAMLPANPSVACPLAPIKSDQFTSYQAQSDQIRSGSHFGMSWCFEAYSRASVAPFECPSSPTTSQPMTCSKCSLAHLISAASAL